MNVRPIVIALTLASTPAVLRADPGGEAVEALAAAAAREPGNAAVLARLSRAWSERAAAASRRNDKAAGRAAAQNAVAAAERAVAAGDGNAAAHLALAIALGKQTDFVDNRTKMALSRKIRAEAERAAALDPRDPLPPEILGRWKLGFATLSPVLRMAARVAYGALPEASLEEAARDLEKSASLDPKRISPHHQLALVYQAMDRPQKAAAEWRTVLALTPEDADDRESQEKARAALR